MKFLICLIWAIFTLDSHAAYIVKRVALESGKFKNLDIIYVDKKIHEEEILLKSFPLYLNEDTGASKEIYQEILYRDDKIPLDEFKIYKEIQEENIFGSELRTLIEQGKTTNRINLTILGDGYTEAEKEKFFEDARRMTDDLFKEVSFASYLPLFNVYAVFVPSKESGITDTKRVNTAFGLYRNPKASKRAIMPGDSLALERAIRLAPATDYPIVIANDDYYGGLGGRYAITTRSLTSGSIVLRHELGHNFGNVGEEYDGGVVYSGANFSTNPEADWGHWLNKNEKMIRYDSKFLTGAYVWKDLSTGAFTQTFNFPDASRFLYQLQLSSVGWSTANDVNVYLDEEKLELDGVFTNDRSFFNTVFVPLNEGPHSIKIEEKIKDGDNVLAYANGYAYPSDYDFTEGKIAAFNVFDSDQNKRGYRPTHESCLMRDMSKMNFCSIDKENMWLKFLQKVNLIDEILVNSKTSEVELKTPNIEGLEIRWFKKGSGSSRDAELTNLRNKISWQYSRNEIGQYDVEVKFVSSEVRKKDSNLTVRKNFTLN